MACIRVMSFTLPIELFVAIINALLSRAAVRNLYDVYNMVNKDLFLSEVNMLSKCIIAYTVIYHELIPDIWVLMNWYDISKKIKSNLLSVTQKEEHVLLEQMKQTVKSFFKQFTNVK